VLHAIEECKELAIKNPSISHRVFSRDNESMPDRVYNYFKTVSNL